MKKLIKILISIVIIITLFFLFDYIFSIKKDVLIIAHRAGRDS